MELDQVEFIVAKLVTSSSPIKILSFSIIISWLLFKWVVVVRRSPEHDHPFPAITFGETVNDGEEEEEETPYCVVCLHDISGDDQYRKLSKCNHCFHVHCIDAWLKSHSTCPLCRSQIPLIFLPNHQNQRRVFFSGPLSYPADLLSKVYASLNDDFNVLMLCGTIMS